MCHIALTLSCQGLAPFQGRRGLVLLDLFEPRTWHSAGIKKYGPNLKMQKSKHKIFKTVLNWHFFGYYIVVLQNACEMINIWGVILIEFLDPSRLFSWTTLKPSKGNPIPIASFLILHLWDLDVGLFHFFSEKKAILIAQWPFLGYVTA